MIIEMNAGTIGGTDHDHETGQTEKANEADPEKGEPVVAGSPVGTLIGMVAICVQGKGVPVEIEKVPGEVSDILHLY